MTGVLVLGSGDSRDEWMALRRSGIGASEIAAVAGLARSRGPWDVWSSKVDGRESESTEEQDWGTWIEQRIIDWWADRTGLFVADGGLYRHPDYPWLIATPDALVVTDPEDPDPVPIATVDAKNAGWRLADEWDDDGAPIEYICQKTWQMLAVGVRRGYLVAQIGGKPPVGRELDLDDDLAQQLIRHGGEFWPYVETLTPPPLDSSVAAATWIVARYPDADPASIVDLSPGDLENLRQLIETDEAIARMQEARRGLETALKDRLATATAGSWRGKTYITWKTVERAGYEVKPTTYRRFTIRKTAKEELKPNGHNG
jgi:putative phage-type endonuclease